ncbi:phytanoyl-CoA dioxygenase family protein [Paraburkholderia sp. RP-4-7]|uniref:Phytanoyl-CoA dioxygenase family protein n=1 Tax=Paraburkholderia polaris TaxID=2728848 RepID=A0A848ILS0_9BURK|nr:phytanoyl-CoA dioxygenase family protein [Paraburkholderia polaris]NMM02210.1 phytanoyl-CoA dioxygenase family protein [Paraburkholderia polaris]
MISNRNFVDLEFGRDNGIREKSFSPALLHVLDIVNQGYTVVRGTSAQLAKCDVTRAAFARFKQRNPQVCERHADEYGHLPPLANLHGGLPELINLFSTHTLILEILDHFLEEGVVFSSSYTERSSAHDAERDAPMFRTEPEHLYMGLWFALEDMDDQNGSLTLVPKAHALPELDREKILRSVYQPGNKIDPHSPELWNAYQAELRKQCEQAGLAEQAILVKKGDVVVWHPDMLHGEARVADPLRTRHALVMQVTPPDIQIGLQDVFYGGRTLPATQASLLYKTAGTRRYVDHQAVGFGQQVDYPISDLSF